MAPGPRRGKERAFNASPNVCASCCCLLVKVSEHSESVRDPNKRPQATFLVIQPMGKEGTSRSKKISMTDILNYIFLLPRSNPLTAKLAFCTDCAQVLAQIYGIRKGLDRVVRPGAQLTFALKDLKTLIRKNIYCFWSTPSEPLSDPGTLSSHSLPNNEGPELKPDISADHDPSSKQSLEQELDQLMDYSDLGSNQMKLDLDAVAGPSSTPTSSPVPEPWMDDDNLWPTTEPETQAHAQYDDPCPVLSPPLPPQPVVFSISTRASKLKPRILKKPRVTGRPSEPDLLGNEPSTEPTKKKLNVKKQKEPFIRIRAPRRKPGDPPRPRKKRVRLPKPKITHPPCPHCGRVFVNTVKRCLETHIALSHKFVSKFTCDICGRPLPSRIEKIKHARTHMSTAEREDDGAVRYKPKKTLCPECGKYVCGSITVHLNTHRPPEERKLSCKEDSCKFSCLGPNTLQEHKNRVHGDNPRLMYQCVKCQQTFRLYDSLKEHQMLSCELEARPHTCRQCDRRFKIKPGLLQHYLGVHKLSPQMAHNLVYPKLSKRPVPEWIGKPMVRKRDTRSHIRKRGIVMK